MLLVFQLLHNIDHHNHHHQFLYSKVLTETAVYYKLHLYTNSTQNHVSAYSQNLLQ